MLRKLSLYTLLLCVVPFFVWIFDWHWQPSIFNEAIDYPLFLLTETGSVPYALITCVLFVLLLFFCIPNRKMWALLLIVSAGSVIVTQGIKSGLKFVYAEPRPYVVAMAAQADFTAEEFYQLTRKVRSEKVEQFYQNPTEVPSWLQYHHKHEVGYSFPSGHSIFAASWLMLVLGFAALLSQNTLRMRVLTLGTAIWALLMLISRVRLGMHYPIDLFVSILLSWACHYVLFAYLIKFNIVAKLDRFPWNFFAKKQKSAV